MILLYSPEADKLEILAAAVGDQLCTAVTAEAVRDLNEAKRLAADSDAGVQLIVCDGSIDLSGAEAVAQSASCNDRQPVVTVVLVDDKLAAEKITALYRQGVTVVIRRGDSLGMLWSRVAAAGKFWCEIASLP